MERITFLAEGYSVVTPLPVTIANNRTENLQIAHTANQEGAFSTTMQVYTNDPTKRMQSVTVSGDVYEPNALVLTGETHGATYDFALALEYYSEIVAIQADIIVPEGLTNPRSTVAPNRCAAHNISLSLVAKNTYRLLVFSMNNSLITGHSGDILTLHFDNPAVTSMAGKTLQVQNIVLSDKAGINKSSQPTTTLALEDYYVEIKTSLAPADAEKGSIKGGGVYPYGSSVTLTATPNEGYEFVQWSDGVKDNPRTVTVTGNATYMAEFAASHFTITYIVEGDTIATQDYTYRSSITPLAEPSKEGYTFSGWSAELPSTMPAHNVTVTGSYTINQYTIIVEAENGVVTGAGIYDYGTEITLTATPNEGYEFVQWNDSVTDNPRTIVVTENATYVAIFAQEEILHEETALPKTTISTIIVMGRTIYCDRECRIYSAVGQDVTAQNGYLTTGVYIVQTADRTVKVLCH